MRTESGKSGPALRLVEAPEQGPGHRPEWPADARQREYVMWDEDLAAERREFAAALSRANPARA